MSRSFRHTPIRGVAVCRSEKESKQEAHKRERKFVRNELKFEDGEPLNSPREFGNVWDWGKDGKTWIYPEFYTPDQYAKQMRK